MLGGFFCLAHQMAYMNGLVRVAKSQATSTTQTNYVNASFHNFLRLWLWPQIYRKRAMVRRALAVGSTSVAAVPKRWKELYLIYTLFGGFFFHWNFFSSFFFITQQNETLPLQAISSRNTQYTECLVVANFHRRHCTWCRLLSHPASAQEQRTNGEYEFSFIL